MRFLSSLLLLVVLPLQQSAAFDYIFVEEPEEPAIVLTDVETGISEIKTIFLNELVGVTATGIEWEALEDGETVPDVALWENSVDGTVQASGELNLTDVGRVLPDELDAGEIKISSRGRHKIVVTLALNGTSFFEASGEYEAYAAGVSIIPLIVVLIMAASTRMVSHMSTGVLVVVLLTEILNIAPLRTLTVSSSTKLFGLLASCLLVAFGISLFSAVFSIAHFYLQVELSLFTAIFVGACMVTGSLKGGFLETLNDYILLALANEDHGYVYLFTLFLSGMVGMMEKSGGMAGFTKDVQQFARTPRTGQFACFGVGVFVFFDDYANVLLAGETMRPLLDMLCVSREKLAFIVDATGKSIHTFFSCTVCLQHNLRKLTAIVLLVLHSGSHCEHLSYFQLGWLRSGSDPGTD